MRPVSVWCVCMARVRPWGSGEEGQLADERMCDGEAHHGDFEALTRSPGVRQRKVVVHHAGIRVVGVG